MAAASKEALSRRIGELLAAGAAGGGGSTKEATLLALAEEVRPLAGEFPFGGHGYQRHLLHLGREWEVLLISWSKGSRSPIHDHRGGSGSILVMEGCLAEERFGFQEGRLHLFDERLVSGGETTGGGPELVHRIIADPGPVLTLHAYRPPLRTMGIWDEGGLVEIRHSTHEGTPAPLDREPPL
jgi:hypothetical protein